MKEVLTLQTESPTLYLRELATEADDIALHQAVIEHPEYSDNFGNTMIKHLGTLKKVRDKRLSSPNDVRMGIWDRDEFVGIISARPQDSDPSTAEIGYFVRKELSGNGYATLALKALAPYALTKYSHIFAEVNVNHSASARVLEKAGFVSTKIKQKDWGMAKVFVPTNQAPPQ